MHSKLPLCILLMGFTSASYSVSDNGNAYGLNKDECITEPPAPWEQRYYTSKYLLNLDGEYYNTWEWAPKENLNYRCILVEGYATGNGVACYPLPK